MRSEVRAPEVVRGKYAHLLVGLSLCVLTSLVYSNSFRSGFVFDNRPLILQDPRVHSATAENVKLIFDHTYFWPRAEHGLYRPFTTLSYLFNYAILGNADRPSGYHWINLLLHLCNVLLVYALALKLSGRLAPSALAAALWAVHPVLTETVTNIAGRADLLAGMSVLCATIVYLKSRSAAGAIRLVWLAGLIGSTLLGMYSKESAIVIAGIIVLYELSGWKNTRDLRSLTYAFLAISLPVALLLWQRANVLANATAPEFHYLDNPLIGATFLVSRLTAVKVLAKYLALFLLPVTLSSDYSYSEISLVQGSFFDWIACAVIAAVTIGAVFQVRRRPLVFFLAGFAFICIFPVSNLVFLLGSIMAERFLYLPAIGLAGIVVMFVFALGHQSGRAWLAPAILCLAIAACGIRTWQRNLDWRDDLSFWKAAVRNSPNSAVAHRGYAAVLDETDAGHADKSTAIAEIEKALAIVDRVPDRMSGTEIFADAGKYYGEQGDYLARADSATGSPADPAVQKAYENSLRVLQKGVSVDRAVGAEYVRQEESRGIPASEIAPVGLPQLYEQLAVTYMRLREPPNAIEAARYARKLAPQTPESHNVLIWVLVNSDHKPDAATALIAELLVTGDRRAIAQLEALYRGGLDEKGCALLTTAQGTSLNPSCELVRREFCSASADLAEIYSWNRRADLADAVESRAMSSYGCTAGK